MGLDWVDAIEEELKETLDVVQRTALIKRKPTDGLQLAEGLKRVKA